MRRFLLAISIQLSAISFLMAADILPEQALQIANEFVQHDKTAQANIRRAPAGTRVNPSIAHKMPSRVAQNKDNVYIVNLGGDQGFVVVSGETGTVSEILGYCDHGSFNYEDAPVQMQDLLNEYSAGIDSLRQNPLLASPQMPARVQINYPSYIGDIVVGPLLTTLWSQNAPYNIQCPSNENGHCYTGCVPTAVAQVMNYWKWPKMSKDSVYGLKPDGTHGMIDFSGHVYDWNHMLDYYGWSIATDSLISYNNTQANAVAKLMADIGTAMGTSYCAENGSPTFYQADALIQNFGYQPGIQYVHGDMAANVKSALIAELDEKRPVFYVGYPTTQMNEDDGHALVCDGYTKNNYFHFNFGWGGQTDGFYKLSAVPSVIHHVEIWTNVRPYDAIEKEIDGIKYGLLPNGTADILEYVAGSYGSQNGVLIIPDSVTNEDTGLRYAVTHIYKQAFFRKGNFTRMVMGNNIEAIDRFSFVYTNIDTLVLSDKMEVVPEEAFQVTNVKHLTIGTNIKRIGARAFYACPIKDIVCKSSRVELERECFVNARLNRGDWENCIVKIGKRAFAGAKLDKDTYFANLEILGDSAISGVMWGNNGVLDFTIGPKVREIAPSAFDGFDGGWNIPMLRVHNDNPYFASDQEPIIYNKDTTTVHLVLKRADFLNMTKVLKMEPGCMRGAISSMTIPPTVVDMEGAFKDCMPPKYVSTIICQHMVPPAISDATFPDTLFSGDDLHLRVPEGTEALYAEAPGWRKFGLSQIEAMYEEDYLPLPPQDLQYQMKIHGDSLRVAAPVSEVSCMRMTEENGETMVTLQVNGRANLKAPVSRIDSIIFAPGFVYEGAEIFDLNDSNLTVNAHRCTISFDPTTFDENAQVCVRNSVLLPRPMEGVTGGIGIDISMLNDSGRVHELSGVATITIPFSVSPKESVGAAYFNEQTGEWEPVYMEYDRNAGVATILTDHLSHYAFVSVMNENTKTEIFEAIKEEIPILHAWDEATKKLLDILASDDPEIEQKFQFKNEMSLWQSLGLDGFYNGAIAIADPLFNFKPKALDDAVTIMGHIGTALTVLDVIRADLHGDQIAVASGTLKVIMARTGGVAATSIGTPIMAASMCMVAFIGVALDKFGTYIQDIKMDYFRRAYRYYYSLDGSVANRADSKFNYDAQGRDKPHGYYRTAKDWYDYFYPVFTRTDMDADQLMRYIEHSVRMYCDQFWEENSAVQDYCMMIAQQSGWNRPGQELTDAQEQQISNELFSDLMNGELVSVFTALRKKQIVQAHNSAISKINNMAKMMNKKVGFKIIDSSVQAGQTSSFAGWSIGFPVLAENVADPDKWRKTIGNDGKVALGWFTTYALVRNLVPFKITLYNRAGEAVKDFEFELDGEAEKKTIHIDLATEGMIVENKHLDDLHLTYNPATVEFYAAGIRAEEDDQYDPQVTGELVYMDENTNFLKDQTRWCTEVECFFNRHNFITADTTGNFTIGDDIAGKFDGDTATGTFILNTDYKFFIQTAQQYVDKWNSENCTHMDRIKIILNGSCKHQIACTYKIKRRQAGDHDEYDITYTGQGAYDMTVRHINNFNKSIDWGWGWAYQYQGGLPPLFINEIGIGTSSDGGDVTLEYTTTLK